MTQPAALGGPDMIFLNLPGQTIVRIYGDFVSLQMEKEFLSSDVFLKVSSEYQSLTGNFSQSH